MAEGGWFIFLGALAGWWIYRIYRRWRTNASFDRQYQDILTRDSSRVRGRFD
jgi:hypothetical protein